MHADYLLEIDSTSYIIIFDLSLAMKMFIGWNPKHRMRIHLQSGGVYVCPIDLFCDINNRCKAERWKSIGRELTVNRETTWGWGTQGRPFFRPVAPVEIEDDC